MTLFLCIYLEKFFRLDNFMTTRISLMGNRG